MIQLYYYKKSKIQFSILLARTTQFKNIFKIVKIIWKIYSN